MWNTCVNRNRCNLAVKHYIIIISVMPASSSRSAPGLDQAISLIVIVKYWISLLAADRDVSRLFIHGNPMRARCVRWATVHRLAFELISNKLFRIWARCQNCIWSRSDAVLPHKSAAPPHINISDRRHRHAECRCTFVAGTRVGPINISYFCIQQRLNLSRWFH